MTLQWIGVSLLILMTCGSVFVVFLTYSDLIKLGNCEREYNAKKLQNLDLPEGRCFKDIFYDVLLVVVFNFGFYDNIPLLRQLYGKAFPHIAFCGAGAGKLSGINISFDLQHGLFGYHCLGLAIEKYPRFKGYFYINDDMIVNFWNFVDFDRDKIWQGALITNGAPMFVHSPSDDIVSKWIWFNSTLGLRACVAAYKEVNRTFPNWKFKHFEKNLLHNGNNVLYCSKGWSDLFYIPSVYAKTFMQLSKIFRDKNVFLEIAVTTIIRMLDEVENTVKLSGYYLPDMGASDSRSFWKYYRTDIKFVHPFKLHVEDYRDMNVALLNNWILKYVNKLTSCNN